MAAISEYPLTNTGAEVQTAIDDALTTLPYQIGLKANLADVLTKTNTTAWTPTGDYQPATKAYVDTVRPTVTVGQTITGAEGTDASVTNSGTDRDAILNFTIPRGNTGAAAGFDTPTASVTTLAPSESATVSITATGPDTLKKFAFQFGIPQGIQGIQGVQGFYVNNVVRTSGSGAAGTTDTYTMYLNDAGQTSVGTFTVYNGTNGTGAGTVTSIGLQNVTDGSLTITDTPVTNNGVIKIKHSNAITAQTTQAVYPITIDRSGHITGYGAAQSIGDMFKATYDTDNNGIVDGAESLHDTSNQIWFSLD